MTPTPPGALPGAAAAKAEVQNTRTNRYIRRLATAAFLLLAFTGVTTVVLQTRANQRADKDRDEILRIGREIKQCTDPTDRSTECQRRLAQGQAAVFLYLHEELAALAAAAEACGHDYDDPKAIRECVLRLVPNPVQVPAASGVPP